jgi:isoamylase
VSEHQVDSGRPWPLGATWDGAGVNFALFSVHAEKVELCLFNDQGNREIARLPLPEFTDQVWHGYLPHCRPGQLYGYRVYGPFDPENGHRFNPHKLLVDPYARAIVGAFRWSDAHFGYKVGHPRGDLSFDRRDNGRAMVKCQVVDPAFTWGNDRPPAHSLADSVIYEAHVKGFTRRHPDVPKPLRGSFAGLASPGAIGHLKRLGVTTIELLPVHRFLDDRFLRQGGLVNYWGYNSLGFFAPEPRYDSGGGLTEFKTMVKRLHDAGIEVILDVVYNHTAEAGQNGPTLSFRGIDNASYYRLRPGNRRYYEDFTGCGNSLNLGHPRVLQMVTDSLRYWVGEMHVDGFRFDLATALARAGSGFDAGCSFLDAVRQDPLLSRVKLIAEPWDLGPGGYQVGGFPPGWSEWNDRFRDTVRSFWLHRSAGPGELALRLAASSDLFRHDGRRPTASVNFVTSHDGFTLADLVAYNHKHNEANGEGNQDGTNDNRSWNGGVEGPTGDPEIVALRARLKRTLLATLLLSQGVPMLLAGDELGRSQGGNNNAYCQDNETSWLDWSAADEDLCDFVARLVALRRRHPALRRNRWLEGRPVAAGDRDVVWLSREGTEMTTGDWQARRHSFGFLLGATAPGEEAFLVLLNGEAHAVEFTLPPPRWALLVDTAEERAVRGERLVTEAARAVPPRSLVLLRRLPE